MFKFAGILFIIIGFLLPTNSVLAANNQQAVLETLETKQIDKPLLAVTFYSNWCGACLLLDPKIKAAKPAFEGRPIDFVKFDFSFAMVRGKALQALADEKNLTQIYQNNKGKTGFMLLVEPDSGQVLDVITMNDSTNDIAVKFDHHLRR